MGLLQIRDAASCIQQTWRGFVCRQRYYNLVYSAITIQSFARGMIVREQTRRQEHAAVLIQRTWWNFVDSWRMNWAATTIQRLWRGFNARIDFERKLIEEEEAFEQAATIIQGAWRGFAAQVEFQLDLLDIISVQNLARKKIATRRRNDIVKSVAVLQGAARYWLAKRSFETKFQERDAAITCQCAIRCWLSSRELSNRQQRYKCATLIQSHWRRYAERMAFSLLLTTTIYIQAFVRGHHDRRQMVLWSQSASTIQRTWRSFSLDVQNENACTEIQRTWRAYSSRKKYEISRVSAVSVQRCWRGYAVRDALEKQQFAATILQSCWRGFMSRMNFQLDLLEIIFVQNAVRRYLAKREAAVRREATQVIQNVSRCFLAARLADTLRKQMIEWETSHKAAICIQVSRVTHILHIVFLNTVLTRFGLFAVLVEVLYRSETVPAATESCYANTVVVEITKRSRLLSSLHDRRDSSAGASPRSKAATRCRGAS
jgi:myosin heavy subunit